MKKQRLDHLLVEKGYFINKEQAKRSILAGLVLVNQEKIDKAGFQVPFDAQIKVKKPSHPYVSRGGLKLAKALDSFSIQLHNRIVIDIGASTGGFTDCALQNGAKLVYAVDVGYGQLAWKLRQDSRVVVMERTNFRYLQKEQLLQGAPDFATIDVSFISLGQILPVLAQIISSDAEIVALIKPQFEAKRDQTVGTKGIIRDPAVHLQVIQRTFHDAEQFGFTVKGLVPSPIRGSEGNTEFLCYLTYGHSDSLSFDQRQISTIVQDIHQT